MFIKFPSIPARSIQDDNSGGDQMLYHFAAMKNALVRHAVFLLWAASLSAAQGQNASSVKTEYLEDFAETCKHLDQLSQAIPASKYAWRPGAGVRSVSEVYVHIANGNFLLLSLTGVKLPAEYFPNLPLGAKGKPDTQAVFKRMGELEKTVTDKDAVTRMLKSSLDEVRNRFSQLTAAELDRPADFFGEKTTVRRIYLRIFAHVNEHYGQSVAYARVNGIVPPWSQKPE
jgi:DinB superfamily